MSNMNIAGEQMYDHEGDELQLVPDQRHPFFLRLLARDNSSSRRLLFSESLRYFVLHGAAGSTGPPASVLGFVPFTWESSPGIPKQDYVVDHHHDQGPICPGRPLNPPPAISVSSGCCSRNHHRHHSSASLLAPHAYSSSIGPPAYPTSITSALRSASIASAPAHYYQCPDGYDLHAICDAAARASVHKHGLASRFRKLFSRRIRRLHYHTSCSHVIPDSPRADSFVSGSTYWRMLLKSTESDQFVRDDGAYLSPSRSPINGKSYWPEDETVIKTSNRVDINYTCADDSSPARSRLDNALTISFTDESANSPINGPSPAGADQDAGFCPFTDQSMDSPVFNKSSPAAHKQDFFYFHVQSTNYSPTRESSPDVAAGGMINDDELAAEKDDIDDVEYDAAGGMNDDGENDIDHAETGNDAVVDNQHHRSDERNHGKAYNCNGTLDSDRCARSNGQLLIRQILEMEQPLSSRRIHSTRLLVEGGQPKSLPRPAKKTISCLPSIKAKRKHSTKREHSTYPWSTC